ncbi:MAG TPA: diguanylate cyclase [Stenomitos sp.]
MLDAKLQDTDFLLNEIERLHQEMEGLKTELETIRTENDSLHRTLAATADQDTVLENQIKEAKQQLQTEIGEHQRTQATLQNFVNVISKQKDDLEIILQTLVEHGDVLDLQWQQKVSQSTQMANLDSLTQIANRRRFDEYLESQWHILRAAQATISVLLCDVDFFKQYNDTYGHLAGDECLKKIVEGLNSALLREHDLLARYGGEEFAVIFPYTNNLQALTVAQRMQDAIAKLALPHAASPIHPCITVSMGIACVVPTPERTITQLLDTADRQMYLAKQGGRNRIIHTFLK